MKHDFDIVVIGAGMVGAATAGLLASGNESLRIGLVEAREPKAPDPDPASFPGLRVSAISRASQRVLEACSVWDALTEAGVSPYREMRVWDADAEPFGHGSIHFDSAELGLSCLGHIIDNGLIQWALWRHLMEHPRVTVVCPARLTELELDEDRALLRLDDGQRLKAALVVGADGSSSPSRKLAGIEADGKSYQQSAVVCHIGTEASHRETAWQRFLIDGPIGMLPLQDGRCSIVWSTTPEHAEALCDADQQSFLQQVTAATGSVLGAVTSSGPRARFPLRLQHARNYTATRFVLVGDAAHTVHPLAGQGVNLGFLDAAALAEVVLDAIAAERDPGERPVLRRYERWRKGENLLAAGSIDAIGRLFLERNATVASIRRLGLSLVNGAPMVKNEIVRRAMGLAGDLPRFARAPTTTGPQPSWSE
ncbi:MAG: UbiH/UbiF/VisC/COQ6 family ubiquinone biosynthesis hydroxylase [Gammaproteobacteria bacterium]